MGSRSSKDAPAEGSAGLFHDIRFAVILSDDFDELKASQITAVLTSNGAEHDCTVDCAKSFSITDITHIISTTADFAMFDTATDSLKSILRPNWVHDCLKRNRLVPQKPYNPDPRLIFLDVIVLCVDLPEGDQDAVMAGVLAMGGQYVTGLSRSVTHVVALSENNDICLTALQSKDSNALIVLPHWFDDCLKLRRRLSEKPYILPDPEILKSEPLKTIPIPNTSRVNGATQAHEEDAPPNTCEEGLKAQRSVFQGRSFALDKDLGLSAERKKTIKQIITSGGGTVESTPRKADILICRYRDGAEFRRFADDGKIIGTMSWLYYLITYNKWSVPTQRLLHFPVAKGGLPGFGKFRIAASGYSGPARVYIESLVKATGATFTKAMRQDNTHLIAAQAGSEKGRAAEDWNIHKVNHLWLEESYAKWEAQSVSNPRYSHFPARINLTEIVGSTPIDLEVVKAELDEPPQSSLPIRMSNPSTPIKSSGQTIRMKTSDSSLTPIRAKLVEASKTLKRELSSSTVRNGVIGQEDEIKAAPVEEVDNGESKTDVAMSVEQIGDAMEVDDPSPVKRETNRRSLPPVGLEMQDVTPARASRAAKTRATALLHETIAPDIAMYEKEKKRKSGNIWGGIRGAGASVSESPVRTPLKRSIDQASPEAESGADSVERDGKRVRSNKNSPQVECIIRLAVTNYDPWNAGKKKMADERKLRDLGIRLTEDVSECTHIAAPKIVRTAKFVTGIASGACIVSSAWLDSCLKENRLCDTSEYLLADAAGEKKFNMSLAKSLARAKKNQSKLLDGCTVFCAPNVIGGFETVNAIVSANGGLCIPFKSGTKIVKTDVTKIGKEKRVVLLSTEQDGDKKLWSTFERLAGQAGQHPRIVTNEWLITVAMVQEQKWDPAWLLSGD